MKQEKYLLAFVAAVSVLLSACTATKQVSDTGFKPPSGNYRLLVMQPDISVGVLTAGGAVEPHEEWTNQARKNVLTAIESQQAGRGGETKIAATLDEAGGDVQTVKDLVWLHKAVGGEIQAHKYAPFPLPTKKDSFDWTLGETAVQFGTATGYDYALFVHAQDSFSSGGRVALQVAGALTCIVGVCVVPAGGQQLAFASLVDLKTGRVAWFNILAASVGDIRSPEGARKMVTTLLGQMNASGEKKAVAKR
jgi:hypothetical protein